MINAPISVGELADKLTILAIKYSRLHSATTLREYGLLFNLWNLYGPGENTLHYLSLMRLIDRLREINEKIWRLEDHIRDCERRKDFGEVFIETARDIYKTNDRRAAVKHEIDALANSEITELKSYAPY